LYQSTLDEKEEEQINSVRVIKKEVIDLADMMDKMSGILIQNNKNIDESGTMIDDIRHILYGANEEGEGEDKEDMHMSKISEDEIINGALPDLYSLRRSPFYQIKIV
jgi:hypothetical protein